MNELGDNEGFSVELENGEQVTCVMENDGNTHIFTRADSGEEERYTIEFTNPIPNGAFKVVRGCMNLTLTTSNGYISLGGYVEVGDVYNYRGRNIYVASFNTGTSIGGETNICLLKGTMIKVDDIGEVPIERIRKGMTIAGYEIKGLSQGTSANRLVRIERGAFTRNIPNKDTFVTEEHSILIDNKLIVAGRLASKAKGIEFVDVSEQPAYKKQVYNVLCSEWITMEANGMPVESLHPKFDKKNDLVLF